MSPLKTLIGMSGEIVRERAACTAVAPSLSLPPLHTFGRRYYSVRRPSEPRDVCAGGSNTICNNKVVGSGGALRDNSTVVHAAMRLLITHSLPKTQQICAVTEKAAVCTVHK